MNIDFVIGGRGDKKMNQSLLGTPSVNLYEGALQLGSNIDIV
jgi:hypothetical protein